MKDSLINFAQAISVRVNNFNLLATKIEFSSTERWERSSGQKRKKSFWRTYFFYSLMATSSFSFSNQLFLKVKQPTPVNMAASLFTVYNFITFIPEYLVAIITELSILSFASAKKKILPTKRSRCLQLSNNSSVRYSTELHIIWFFR